MQMRSILTSFTVATALVALPAVASAAPHAGKGYSYGTAGAELQYGIWTSDGDLNAYGIGINLRAGYTIRQGVYFGGAFDYFFGEEDSAGFAGAGASVHANVYDFMGEVGYDFWVSDLDVIRPKLGLGVGVTHGSFCANAGGLGGGCNSDSDSGLALSFGGQYMHFFDPVYLSAELRYQTITADGPDPSAIVLGIGVGFDF